MEASDFMSRVEKIMARLEQPMVILRRRQRWWGRTVQGGAPSSVQGKGGAVGTRQSYRWVLASAVLKRLPGRHEGALLVAQGVQDVGGHQAQLHRAHWGGGSAAGSGWHFGQVDGRGGGRGREAGK